MADERDPGAASGDAPARRERDEYRELLDLIPSYVWWKDAENRILRLNRRAAESMGLTVREAEGRSTYDLYPEHAEKYHRDDLEVIRSGRPKLGIVEEMVLASGDRRWVRTDKIPWRDARGRVAGVMVYAADITDLKRAEEALRESEARLRALTALAPVGILRADLAGRVTFSNAGAARLSGLDPERALDAGWIDAIHPEDRARVASEWMEAAAAGRPFRSECRMRRPDGAVSYVIAEAVPERGEAGELRGFVGVVFDITERRRAEEALRKAETRFRLATAGAEIGLWDWDVRTGEVYFSPEWKRQLGCEDHEIAHRFEEWESRLHPEDRDRAVELALSYEKSPRPVYEQEFRLRHKDGSYRWILARAAVLPDERGALARMVGVHVDLTERKRAEDERREMDRRLQEAAKLESLGVLAGGVAHDFNNLLTGILGNASLARMGRELDPDLEASLAGIERAAQRAADLCRQMLAYSGKGRFTLARIDLNEAVEETARLLRASISRKASLRFDLRRPLPAVEADPVQIRQIVMNLVVNASDALGGEEGVVSIATGVLASDAPPAGLPPGEYVVLEVSDTGCGMDEGVRARVFEPFFTTKSAGRGLGLAAAQGIVRGHGGAIEVSSEPGRGAAFRVLLPAVRGEAEPFPAAAPAAAPWRGEGTALVVDDEETVRAVAARILEGLGLRVVAAEDGLAAAERLRERPEAISLVLLDLTMPRQDGERTFRALRAIRPDLPVILMSGYNEQEATASFVGRGLAGFVAKPFRAADLAAKVREALEGRGRREG